MQTGCTPWPSRVRGGMPSHVSAFIVQLPPPLPLTTTSSQNDLNLWVESYAALLHCHGNRPKNCRTWAAWASFLSDDVRCKNIEAALQAGERGEEQSSRWTRINLVRG
ncbi:hypothetical protein NEUTE1DRAFT_105626 [Neurospora tetrasperma FGSC 2508]|uniref:Uncharacterized protein n=1 Tax=Neurospora tetrasperma (strain FGSC 2508 / ATCC MYA-4615 / P0657) TaxID=510951 RepID=F8N403_NEUT8|nr:uncharacterized protein NEUTE1DRAFT_105626 [Neurospora tetrasperma FGSC 2508]EGO52650.1 hypothetical protein NEUTE1DRAFT_105626 [Neurospora tetrasperma FGSC 2508]